MKLKAVKAETGKNWETRVKRLYGNPELNQIKVVLVLDSETFHHLIKQAELHFDSRIDSAIQLACIAHRRAENEYQASLSKKS